MLERITKVLADQGYRGAKGGMIQNFFAQQQRSVEAEISPRPTAAQGNASRTTMDRQCDRRMWLDNARILARDYERLPENHEGMIYVVMIRLMLRRLAKNR